MKRRSSEVTLTDQFCGAGGSSLGARSLGVNIRLAMNHWPVAIETHNQNFPDTDHVCADISATDPRRYQSTDILVTSPECTNHTSAKGVARPTNQGDLFSQASVDKAAERSRATMWDVPRFAEFHQYEMIVVENVIEARHWVMFDAWLAAMHALGYAHRAVFLNSMFTGSVPQSRDRMYVVFWRKGNEAPDLNIYPRADCTHCGTVVEAVQAWKRPERGYGKYRSQYTYVCPKCARKVEPHTIPASTAIDWTIPSRRIGARDKPLAEKTLARIRAGIEKFWPASPLLVDLERPGFDGRVRPVTQPFATQTGRHTTALAFTPFIAELRGGSSDARSTLDPLATVTASGNHHALLEAPRAFLSPYYGNSTPSSVEAPAPTVTGTDRCGLVEGGSNVAVDDCFFRMLDVPEIGRAMAFPDSYTVTGSKRDRVRQYGNAVTPPAMALLLDRCMATLA